MGGSDDDGGAAGALHSVEGCPALRVLSLARCPLVSGAGAARLARCSRLQEVDLSHCALLSDDAARRPPAARPPQSIFAYFPLLYVTLLKRMWGHILLRLAHISHWLAHISHLP
jgi:hypothetical protein